ncbi:MAG: glycosyltransferase [Candidatus Woesearchaeota archaeon]
MNVSAGVIAHNDEKNIAELLLEISREKQVREIIVVSSGSTDKTNSIIERLNLSKVKLIKESVRRGKAHAINIFLKKSKEDVLLLVSADVLPKRGSIRKIIEPLKKPDIGICASRPVPAHIEDSIIGHTIRLQWYLHHRISLDNPKFGEMIAFKKVFTKINKTSVDEEYIAAVIKNLGYKLKYCPDAIVINRPPKTIQDLVKQRRRIYCGHLELRNTTGYKTPTLSNTRVLVYLLKEARLRHIKRLHLTLISVVIETYSRFLGFFDFLTNKEKHYKWEIAKSAK